MKKTSLLLIILLFSLLLSGCSAERGASIAPVAAPDQTPDATPVATVDLSGLSKVNDASTYVNALPTADPDPFNQEAYDGPPSLLDPKALSYDKVTNFEIADTPQLDLSRMSPTMAYAQLYNIFMEQEKYVGQTIKMRGQYVAMRDENEVAKYHFVMVYDNAACCQLGMEFLMTPAENLPKDNSLIELTGVFDICNDAGEKFCVLRVKEVSVLKEATPDTAP